MTFPFCLSGAMEENKEFPVAQPESGPGVPEEVPAQQAEAELEAARQALAEKAKEVQALHDRLLRAHAELENVKKRAARERAEFLKFATEGLLLEFVPVLDNLERAIASARHEVGDTPLLEGVEMTARLFGSVLEKAGVKPIDALGQPFDPARHEAVAQREGSPEEANRVVEVIQKGYLLDGRVLRPAVVKVCRGAPPASGEAAAAEGDPA